MDAIRICQFVEMFVVKAVSAKLLLVKCSGVVMRTSQRLGRVQNFSAQSHT